MFLVTTNRQQPMIVLILFCGLVFFEDTRAQSLQENSNHDNYHARRIFRNALLEETISENFKADEKVKLDIYYETNCPDSMDFFSYQFWPTYQNMSDIVEVNLFPFGKAIEDVRSDGSRVYYCHHGPSECIGNIIQACAINLYPDPKTHVAYISCMESYFRPSRAGSLCAKRSSVDYSRLVNCTYGQEGNDYFHEMAVATRSLNPPLSFVPWIVVNDVFSDAVQERALEDLSGVVCMFYKGQSPACSP